MRGDLTSLGARDQYVERMLNHRERLAKIKPVLKLEAPKAAFGGGKFRTPRPAQRSAYASEEFTEVREAFKRILLSKPTVHDHMPAWKLELGERLSRNRASNTDQFARVEHMREVHNMHRRIAQSHSLVERKKNKLDASLYPALLLRKSASTPPGELWRQAAAKRASTPRGTSPRGGAARSAASPARPHSARARSTAAARGASPGGARGGAPAKPPARPQSARARQPAAAAPSAAAALPDAALGVPKDHYGALREVLLQRIVEARLYREADLRRFLKQVLRDNRQLDHARLQAVVRDVEREFFLAG